MPQLTRITRDPAIMGGKPCIRGMRVTVGTVVGLVAAGRTRDEILREYPYLEAEGHRRGRVVRGLAGRGSRSSAAPAVKLLVDMNLSPSWIDRLVRHGFQNIVTLAEGDITHLHVGLKGTMNALFLKDLADKTRRGLRGRVELGKSGGGLCYGYKVTRPTHLGAATTGDREIVPAEAEVIRRIFRDYAAGVSPKALAKRRLNAERCAAPGGTP